MNGRQAAREAAKRIEELEKVNALQVQDIKDYNSCIQDVIAGKSVCTWCEENRLDECVHASRGSAGCSEWWLRFPQKEEPEGGESGEEGKETRSTSSVLDMEE